MMAVVCACLRVYADIRSAFKTFLLTVSFFEGSAAQRVRGYLNIKHNIKKVRVFPVAPRATPTSDTVHTRLIFVLRLRSALTRLCARKARSLR